MPAKKPIKSTDQRRGKKPPPIKQPRKAQTLEQADQAWSEAASKPFTPLFRDRRNP